MVDLLGYGLNPDMNTFHFIQIHERAQKKVVVNGSHWIREGRFENGMVTTCA